ncbi:OsmC family peroxiredoxin [Rubrobacter taiwanensis]|jgi:osmotically inducible protein OsmC|uniref:OsmC family peroxiredoxin n=1 Tax=Rubrobacter taiwanensis TaxID=185139 RepID=A0A4R1BPQ4_9ACTN|nr:OsmC family peroxiredoxin [Rubrobacter taiwanensis]TCJ19683.1 OsmC family peroxiredoxin [Rubrobacter taiwanensis]
MALAERRAEVVWEGGLARGTGRLTGGSGALGELPVSWPARTERPDGKTSPEELIAAAHAGCYAMALSHVLEGRETPPERLEVSAVCALDEIPDGVKISRVDLSVRGRVPGITAEDFRSAAEEAEQGCPVSNALRGNVDIRLEASLES